jgi:hypothetical protein
MFEFLGPASCHPPHLLQGRPVLDDSGRAVRGFALEEGVIHHGALARIQVLGVLEPHEDVQQVAHADAGVGRPVEEAAAGLEEVAGSVDVAAAQVVEIGLWGRGRLVQRTGGSEAA